MHINEMHDFINYYLIFILLYPTCFEAPEFILRETVVYVVWYVYMH